VSPFVRLAIAELFSAEKRAADQLAGCCAALDGGFEIARRAGARLRSISLANAGLLSSLAFRRGSICFPRVDLFSASNWPAIAENRSPRVMNGPRRRSSRRPREKQK